jgi:hypothetical protein
MPWNLQELKHVLIFLSQLLVCQYQYLFLTVIEVLQNGSENHTQQFSIFSISGTSQKVL